MDSMTRAKFTVALEPEDSEAHVVDAAALGAALIASSSLVKAANRALNGDRYQAEVKIRANPSEGSVEVNLEVVVALWEQARALLTSADYLTAREILELLGFGGVAAGGLMKLVRYVKGRKITKAEPADRGMAEVAVEGESAELVIERKVLVLYQDVTVRASLERLAATAATPGVQAVSIRSSGKELDRIERREVPVYCVPRRTEPEPQGQPIVPVSTMTVALQPVKVWFEKGNKWQFSDGERTFNADVQDETFIDQVISGKQRFGHGDVLLTQLRYETVQTPAGLQTNYTVVKVERVIQSPRQPSLFEESDPGQAE